MDTELQAPNLPKVSGVDGLHEAKKNLRIVGGEGDIGVKYLLAFVMDLPAVLRDSPV